MSKQKPLTEKEITVLRWICKQKTNKEIAEIVGRTTKSVDVNREWLLQKTKAENTAGLVVYAIRNGIYKS